MALKIIGHSMCVRTYTHKYNPFEMLKAVQKLHNFQNGSEMTLVFYISTKEKGEISTKQPPCVLFLKTQAM